MYLPWTQMIKKIFAVIKHHYYFHKTSPLFLSLTIITIPLLICTGILKNQVVKVKFDKLDL